MKQFFTLLMLFSCFAGRTQSADLDKYYFTASYRDLPLLGLDTSYNTFSIRTDLSQGGSYMLRGEQPEDRISITGWKKLRSNADVLVNVQMEDITIDNSEVREREEILKDKTGKEIGRKHYYHMELLYTFAARMQISDYRGSTIIDRVLSDRQSRQVYRTKEYSSSNEALNSFVTNVFAVTSTITVLEVNQTMNNVNAMLNADLGYGQRTVGDFLWILDSKKHPEYRAHRQAWASFKQAMFQMRADKPVDEVAHLLQPVIDYFNVIKRRYTSNSKGDRKMRYASYYNLAKIYYYLDDPDAALFEAGQLMINNYDEKDGRGLEAMANGLKQMFELNRVRTRHFPVYNDLINGPSLAGY